MNWLARWAFRRLVAPRVLAYYWLGRRDMSPGGAMNPDDVEVVFRGR